MSQQRLGPARPYLLGLLDAPNMLTATAVRAQRDPETRDKLCCPTRSKLSSPQQLPKTDRELMSRPACFRAVLALRTD